MKKVFLGLGLIGAIALATPATAGAGVSIAIGLPGFGVFFHEPCPPPVVYGPPVYAPPAYYPPPVAYYYRPVPVFYRRHGYGRHPGWYGHARHWD